MDMKKSALFKLALPIFLQLLLFNLISTVDTLMINEYNKNYVLSMNNANQVVSMLNVLLTIVSTGVAIVISQYLGAKKEEDAKKAFNNGIIFNEALALILFILLITLREPLLYLINCPEKYIEGASSYLLIVAFGIPFYSVTNVCYANLRANKKPAATMIIAVAVNLVNMGLNWLLIFGNWGLPELGIQGAAIATLITYILTFVITIIATPLILKKKIYKLKFSRSHLFQIIKIGLPSALESITYTITGLFVQAAVNELVENDMLARSYINIIMGYIYMFSVAFGQANAILVGHDVGSGDYECAKKRTWQSFLLCYPILIVIITILLFTGRYIIGIMNDDEVVITVAISVIPWFFYYETGRCVNLIFINALKASGDVIFPLICAIVSNILFSALGSWAFGIWMGLGFLGIFLAQASDEFIRGILMLYRWQSNKWKNKAIIKNEVK
jgi:putative MATE family efflux protein